MYVYMRISQTRRETFMQIFYSCIVAYCDCILVMLYKYCCDVVVVAVYLCCTHPPNKYCVYILIYSVET
jgi:hypothetical protein